MAPNNEKNESDSTNNFSEFCWMEHEEDFDREVLEELEEEYKICCYYEEFLDWSNGDDRNSACKPNHRRGREAPQGAPIPTTDRSRSSRSTSRTFSLNPNAAEFIPRAYVPELLSDQANSITTNTLAKSQGINNNQNEYPIVQKDTKTLSKQRVVPGPKPKKQQSLE